MALVSGAVRPFIPHHAVHEHREPSFEEKLLAHRDRLMRERGAHIVVLVPLCHPSPTVETGGAEHLRVGGGDADATGCP